MNNKQRNEMDESKLALHTVRVLESGKCTDQADAATSELGRLLRQSATHELPESNDDLREQLLATLADHGDVSSDVPLVSVKASLDKTSTHTASRRWWAGLAVGALVAGYGCWLYQPHFGVEPLGKQSALNSLDFENADRAAPVDTPAPQSKSMSGLSQSTVQMWNGQSEAAAEVESFKERDLKNSSLSSSNEESAGKPFPSAPRKKMRDKSEIAKAEIGQSVSQQDQRWRSQDGDDDLSSLVFREEKQANMLGSVATSERSPGSSEQRNGARQDSQDSLKLRGIAPTSTSTVVSVPDGGTVLIGGIKRKLNRSQRLAVRSTNSLYDDMLDLEEDSSSSSPFESPDNFKPLGEATDEQYAPIHENAFVEATGGGALSTFSIDVDTASYANMRRFLNSGQTPPRDSIRIEELVNYFQYDYPQPKGDDPFSVNMELANCPWNDSHKLLRVGLKGKDIHTQERPATNLVFLMDVSGSMNSADKLPLLKRGFQMMVEQLGENDRVSIVTYAGNAGVALEPTTGDNTKTINEAIERLTPGGSTHGSAGITLAYKLAQQHFITDGVNKVILATDGDLNVGVTTDGALVDLIKQKASEGVFLTVLGFGTGNLKDGKLEKLADNGNGHYAYIDSNREAHRVLVQQLSGSLVTIAKDVKIQVEFNPAEVKSYRLVGYENRMLETRDFADDRKDAGEIGAGHTVTAIYEIEPTGGVAAAFAAPQGMKYQDSDAEAASLKNDGRGAKLSDAADSGELATVALRYKEPYENTSKRVEFTIKNQEKSFTSASDDFRFAASVAGFGMLMRDSAYAGTARPQMILEIASKSMGDDTTGYRAEFVDLIRKAFAR